MAKQVGSGAKAAERASGRAEQKRADAGTAALTISRPELLIDGRDQEFRRLVHGLFAFLARHEAIRSGHGATIGLAGVEYTVLISIGHLNAEEGLVSINRVADHLHVSGAFVTTITNKLVRLGLVHKEQDDVDRRRVRLRVSAEGGSLLAKLAPTQRQVNDIQFESLSRDDFLRLVGIVEQLIVSSERAVQFQAFLLKERPRQGRAPASHAGKGQSREDAKTRRPRAGKASRRA